MEDIVQLPLTSLAGFPVLLGGDGYLKFGEGTMAPDPEARTKGAMSQVLLYPGEDGPDPLYLMYRQTGLSSDLRAMEDARLRFDITVIYPGKIGREYVKTLGHYHPRVPGQPWSYPEIYQVLHGRAHFLMQRGGEVSGQVEDFVVADFSAGDILVIPPTYGHVTVNPGDDPLVLANWINRDFQSNYAPILLRKGLAFHDVEHKGQVVFMPNDSYGEHPKPRLVAPRNYPEVGLVKGQSIYRAWQEGADLTFLSRPSVAQDLWSSLGVTPID